MSAGQRLLYCFLGAFLAADIWLSDGAMNRAMMTFFAVACTIIAIAPWRDQ